jgi:hypothetical protein
MLNSQIIMRRLILKYKNVAGSLCKRFGDQKRELTTSEILMLLKTPTYRLLLEKTFSELKGRKFPKHLNFEPLELLTINCNSLLDISLHSQNNLISPAPFITSLFEPVSENNTNFNISNSVLTKMFYNLDIFSNVSSKWYLKYPSDTDREILKKTLLQLGRISIEPVEDIAFNIRFICLLSLSTSNQQSPHGINLTFPFFPGIIFFGGNIITEPTKLIEALYHESLHNKWINTFNAFNLIKFELLESVKNFKCLWSKEFQPKEWPFMRAAAAYHVYGHLLSLHQLIIKKGEFDANWSNKRIFEIKQKFKILNTYILQSEKALTEQGKEYFILINKISQMT